MNMTKDRNLSSHAGHLGVANRIAVNVPTHSRF
jgi:hypothetical protein